MKNKEEYGSLSGSMIFPMLFLFLIWLIYYIENKYNYHFSNFGTLPRSSDGLWGILTMPLLHGGFNHIFTNTFPILFLGTMLFYFYKQVATKVFLITYLSSGIFVWIFGDLFSEQRHYHIGASGLIYGLASFLFFSGLIRKHKALFGISLLVAFLYGTIVWGVLPIEIQQSIFYTTETNISWEGHLGGFIAGIGLAIAYRKKGFQKPLYSWDEKEEELDDSNPYWMENDDETEVKFQEKEKSDVVDQLQQAPLHIRYHFKQDEKDDTKD